MKTPREILLEQHCAAEPRLDATRRFVIAQELGGEAAIRFGREPAFATLFTRGLTAVWRELIFPSRRIWAGLAVVWMAIGLVNLSERDNSAASVRPISNEEVLMNFKARQQLMGDIATEGPASTGVERRKTGLPEPRTELVNHFNA